MLIFLYVTFNILGLSLINSLSINVSHPFLRQAFLNVELYFTIIICLPVFIPSKINGHFIFLTIL